MGVMSLAGDVKKSPNKARSIRSQTLVAQLFVEQLRGRKLIKGRCYWGLIVPK